MKHNFSSSKCNICWDCENACGGCVWSEIDPETRKPRFEPVPGWTAEEVYINVSGRKNVKSYHITDCPQFAPDRGKHKKKRMTAVDEEALIDNLAFFFRRLNEVGRN